MPKSDIGIIIAELGYILAEFPPDDQKLLLELFKMNADQIVEAKTLKQDANVPRGAIIH